MISLKIAGLNVTVEDSSELLLKRGEAYLKQDQSCDNADIAISLDKAWVGRLREASPELSYDSCHYLLSGEEFYVRLLEYGGLLLHASAVAVDNKAYLFSASSGTGKSTHTSLWQQYLGEERAVIINDDKPAIRLMDGRFYCCGTPWSGKSEKNVNLSVPLQCITFIERSPVNKIEKMEQGQAIRLLLQHTIRPGDPRRLRLLLELAGKILDRIPVYRMGCNMEPDAARLSYQTLKG